MHSVRVAHLIREMARNHYRSAAARAFLLPGEKMIHEIQAVSDAYQIEYPSVASEFEVQAHLYAELKNRGYDVRGEVKARGCFGLRAAKTGCRFDLVIFQNKKATHILEIKGAMVSHKTTMEATRQGQRYPHFGVPVWTVYGMAGADAVLERLG